MDGTFMLTSLLIVSHYSRRSVPSSTTPLPLYPPNPLSSNSFPDNPLSDPHPLNPVVLILYKNSGGRGPVFPCHPERSEGSAFSLFPYLFTSLLLYIVTSIFRKAQPCLPNSALQLAPSSIPTASTSAPKASAAACWSTSIIVP